MEVRVVYGILSVRSLRAHSVRSVYRTSCHRKSLFSSLLRLLCLMTDTLSPQLGGTSTGMRGECPRSLYLHCLLFPVLFPVLLHTDSFPKTVVVRYAVGLCLMWQCVSRLFDQTFLRIILLYDRSLHDKVPHLSDW